MHEREGLKRSEDHILTTHVGSLIRPEKLIETAPTTISAAFAGTSGHQLSYVGEVAYLDELKRDVATIVAMQIDCGLDIVNDGEFGKSSWAAYILERISGFEIHPERLKPLDWLGRDRERFKEFFATSEMAAVVGGAPAEVCVGPIAYVDDSAVRRDLANLIAAGEAAGVGADDKELFFTSVAPASTAYQGINEYYGSEEEYIFAIADALAVEYKAVIDSGVILQVDDAVLANMYDYLVEQGESVYNRWAQLRVEALNHALAGLPEERIRYHICFGSWHVPHVADAPLEAIVPFMLQVNAGAYSIEAANPRHEHEWTVWEQNALPDGKILVPGVVTHHTTTVEHPALIAQRLERFAAILGRENVIGGTDCGFAQGARIQRVHPEVMWAKFAALSEGARLASEKLWR
jgi:5-methyltetrahydropteroyltriglutamate--homocysteine methyltransferase